MNNAAPELEPADWRTLSDLQVSYGLRADVLVVGFSGRYRAGSAGNPDATYMRAMVAAGFEAWGASAIVLDLGALEYVWGDELDRVFSFGRERDLPVAVVVGPKCEEAVRTLVLDSELRLESEPDAPLESLGWVFRDLASAWRHVAGE